MGMLSFRSNIFLRILLGMMKSTLLINTKETVEQAKHDNEKPKQKRKKKHEHNNEQSWSRNKQSSRREEGVAYLDRRNISMSTRSMGPPCNSRFCRKSKFRHCNDICETMRVEMFNYFLLDLKS